MFNMDIIMKKPQLKETKLMDAAKSTLEFGKDCSIL